MSIEWLQWTARNVTTAGRPTKSVERTTSPARVCAVNAGRARSSTAGGQQRQGQGSSHRDPPFDPVAPPRGPTRRSYPVSGAGACAEGTVRWAGLIGLPAEVLAVFTSYFAASQARARHELS